MNDTPRVTVPVERWTDVITPAILTDDQLNDAWKAPGGEGEFWGMWDDKPHRLIYRLLGHIKTLSAAPAPEEGAVDPLAGWTPHDGVWGEPPALAPETIVHVLRRNGNVAGPYRAGRIEWHHQNADSDPLFYRPAAALATREEAPAEAGEIGDTLFRALRSYKLTNMACEDNPSIGYPLVDLMSNNGTDISTGEEEMRVLADHLSESLRAQPPARSGESQ